MPHQNRGGWDAATLGDKIDSISGIPRRNTPLKVSELTPANDLGYQARPLALAPSTFSGPESVLKPLGQRQGADGVRPPLGASLSTFALPKEVGVALRVLAVAAAKHGALNQGDWDRAHSGASIRATHSIRSCYGANDEQVQGILRDARDAYDVVTMYVQSRIDMLKAEGIEVSPLIDPTSKDERSLQAKLRTVSKTCDIKSVRDLRTVIYGMLTLGAANGVNVDKPSHGEHADSGTAIQDWTRKIWATIRWGASFGGWVRHVSRKRVAATHGDRIYVSEATKKLVGEGVWQRLIGVHATSSKDIPPGHPFGFSMKLGGQAISEVAGPYGLIDTHEVSQLIDNAAGGLAAADEARSAVFSDFHVPAQDEERALTLLLTREFEPDDEFRAAASKLRDPTGEDLLAAMAASPHGISLEEREGLAMRQSDRPCGGLCGLDDCAAAFVSYGTRDGAETALVSHIANARSLDPAAVQLPGGLWGRRVGRRVERPCGGLCGLDDCDAAFGDYATRDEAVTALEAHVADADTNSTLGDLWDPPNLFEYVCDGLCGLGNCDAAFGNYASEAEAEAALVRHVVDASGLEWEEVLSLQDDLRQRLRVHIVRPRRVCGGRCGSLGCARDFSVFDTRGEALAALVCHVAEVSRRERDEVQIPDYLWGRVGDLWRRVCGGMCGVEGCEATYEDLPLEEARDAFARHVEAVSGLQMELPGDLWRVVCGGSCGVDDCESTYTQKTHLATHVRDRKNGPFPCDGSCGVEGCASQFAHKTNLTAHVRDRKNGPFPCGGSCGVDDCESTYTQKTSLATHVSNRKNGPFYCLGLCGISGCESKYAHKRDLAHHFRKVREDNPDFQKWCICGGSRATDMIACENAHCKTEWFHYECAGVTQAEATGDGFKWHCSKCRVVAAPSSSMPEAAGPMDLS